MISFRREVQTGPYLPDVSFLVKEESVFSRVSAMCWGGPPSRPGSPVALLVLLKFFAGEIYERMSVKG